MNEETFLTLAHVLVQTEIKNFEVRCEEILMEALGNIIEEGETYRSEQFAWLAVENEARHIIHADTELNCFFSDVFYRKLEYVKSKWAPEIKPIIKAK